MFYADNFQGPEIWVKVFNKGLYMKNYFIPHELTPWTCNYFLQAA
jgi:hypothetical protein